MILKCDFPAAIVKGLVEHGDGTAYFASLGGYSTYMAQARDQGIQPLSTLVLNNGPLGLFSFRELT